MAVRDVATFAMPRTASARTKLHRSIGVTQKSAWFMLHRLRLAMQTGSFEKMMVTVEVDETSIGGKARNMHKDKRERVITGAGGSGKVAVMGPLERHSADRPSQVRAAVAQLAAK